MDSSKIEYPENSGYYYSVDEANDWFELSSPKKKPNKLVKFYCINDFSIDALTNNYLYGSHPDELNDPYDSFHGYFKIHPFENYSYWYFLFQKIGILSFSILENLSNANMWANYSDNKGFAVVFDIKDFCFDYSGPIPINYIESIHDLDKIKDQVIRFGITSSIKSERWKYENEWRLYPRSEGIMKAPKIVKEVFPEEEFLDRKFKYKLTSIQEIVLGYKFITDEGCHFFEKDKNRILIKTNSSNKIELLEYLIDNKLNIKIIDYGNPKKFELDRKSVEINKIDINSYSFDLH